MMKQSSFAQEDSWKFHFSRLKRKNFLLVFNNVDEFVLSTIYATATERHEDHCKHGKTTTNLLLHNTIMRQPVRSMLILALC